MPVFKFRITPTDIDFQKVMEVFRVDIDVPFRTLPHYSNGSLDALFVRLGTVRDILLRCYYARHWKSCIPDRWTKKCAFKVLRHFLRTRSMTMTSKTIKRNGKFAREYTIVTYSKNSSDKQCIASIVPVRMDMLV